jgi:hypothetical protein
MSPSRHQPGEHHEKTPEHQRYVHHRPRQQEAKERHQPVQAGLYGQLTGHAEAALSTSGQRGSSVPFIA